MDEPPNAASISAFVAGSTGYTGRRVVRKLRQKHVKTITHIRPDSKSAATWSERFEFIGAEVDRTPWKVRELTRTFRNIRPDIVFALLGTTRARIRKAVKEGKPPETVDYLAVDYGMTSKLIQAALHAEINPRFVYLSALGVSEKARSDYYIARYKAETELIESGLPYIIARPSFITGTDRTEKRRGEKIAASFLDMTLEGLAFLPGFDRLRDRYRSVTGEDLASALVEAALNPDMENEILERKDLLKIQ